MLAYSKPITIVGGGLAGLTLGIGLRQRGVPVTVYEVGRYPRHRVCGEFISGRGQEALERLGLKTALVEAGAIPASTVCFVARSARSPARRLRPAALSLSRFTLDALLAREFRERGGELRENERCTAKGPLEGVVLANGRRVQPVEGGWRWFGLKAHARGVRLSADLEMHSLTNGYVGVSRLPGGEVNVCGLLRRNASGHTSVAWQELLRGPAGSALRETMSGAEFDISSFCSVAGLTLRAQRAANSAGCRIGDALTMIPPVTGNGMSMAFEAAELAAEPLARYSANDCSWSQACTAVARGCDEAFRRRLAWAKWLQHLMFSPILRGRWAMLLLNSQRLWYAFFNRTR